MTRTASTSTTRLHRQPARGRGRRLAARLPVTALLIVASCSTGSGPDANDRAIAIYSVVIRTVLTQPPGGQPATRAHDTSVFVAAADTHSPISLEVQAGVVDKLHNVATIRFVDARSEAIDTTDPRRPVVNGGILLTLGTIPTGNRAITVDAQRYEQANATASYTINLHLTGSTWTLTRPPAP